MIFIFNLIVSFWCYQGCCVHTGSLQVYCFIRQILLDSCPAIMKINMRINFHYRFFKSFQFQTHHLVANACTYQNSVMKNNPAILIPGIVSPYGTLFLIVASLTVLLFKWSAQPFISPDHSCYTIWWFLPTYVLGLPLGGFMNILTIFASVGCLKNTQISCMSSVLLEHISWELYEKSWDCCAWSAQDVSALL